MAKPRDRVVRGHVPPLTKTQYRVLLHLCDGDSLTEIAEARNCTVATVKHHVAVVMRRWGVFRSEQVFPAILRWAGKPAPSRTVAALLKHPSNPAE